jgi:hemerythrin-like domain-containing protein
LAAATEMCLVHNMLIRMLNCIYLQAPNVKLEKDISDFAIFMHAFLVTIHEHHGNEEKYYFPWLEELNAEAKGTLDKNVEQHHGFAPGLQAFEDYVKALREEKAKYDGAKVRSLIDAFGTALIEHLKDEITSFEELQKLKIDWPAWTKKVQKLAVDGAETVGKPATVGNPSPNIYDRSLKSQSP